MSARLVMGVISAIGVAYLEGLGFGIGRYRVEGVALGVDSHHRIHIVVARDGRRQIAAAATERPLVRTHSPSEL